MDIAGQISKGLANSALISAVNDELWDMRRPLEGDCKLELFKFDSDKGRDTLWHSSAHILGQALEQEYGCQLCIGPCTTRGEGFYYDAFYGELGLNDNHFPIIEAGAAKAAKEAQPFERIEVTKDQAIEMFSENNFKVEIIKDLPADSTITVYRCGPLVDFVKVDGVHSPIGPLLKPSISVTNCVLCFIFLFLLEILRVVSCNMTLGLQIWIGDMRRGDTEPSQALWQRRGFA